MKLIDLLESLNLDVDKKLLKKLNTFKIKWMTRNSEGKGAQHIDFLASDLVGVYPIMFSKDNVDDLFDILDVDYNTFKKAIKNVDDINPEFRNITEPVYLILLYVLYKINTGSFSNKAKEEYGYSIMSLFIYKMLSSILNHYYGNYNVTMNHALMVRENLHGNSLLARYGSWNNIVRHFSSSVMEDDGLHGKSLRKRFKIDELLYIITNIKTSINSFVYNSNMTLLNIKDAGSKHTLNSTYKEGEDGVMLQDHKNIHQDLMRSSKLLLATGDFYSNSVIEILYGTYVGLNKEDLINGIKVVELLYNDKPSEVNDIFDLLFETTIQYLYIDKQHPPYSRHIVKTIEYLKNYYTSSRVSDKRLVVVKDYMKKHMKKELKKNNRRSIAIANTVMVYIFILANIELTRHK